MLRYLHCPRFAVLAGCFSLAGITVAQLETSASLVADMHQHLERSGDIRSAVIAGDLDGARSAARSLAAENMLGALPYIDELQQHAAEVAAASDLAAAAEAVGKIGQTCGGCHRTSDVDAVFGLSEQPPQESQDLTTQMQRHLWAAEQMWAGLVAGSDAVWQQGADILTEVRLSPNDFTDDPSRGAQFSSLTQRLRVVGERAVSATSANSRGQLYGEFLSLCAACHTLTAR